MEQLPPPKQWRFARKRRRDSSSGEVLEGEAAEEKKDKKEEGEAEVVWDFWTICKACQLLGMDSEVRVKATTNKSQHLSPSQQASVLRQLWVQTPWLYDLVMWSWSNLLMIITLMIASYDNGPDNSDDLWDQIEWWTIYWRTRSCNKGLGCKSANFNQSHDNRMYRSVG